MTSNEAKPHLQLVEDRAPSVPPPDPLIGRTLDGRYRVEAVLGEGGMGLVYRARHAVLQKPLAIKVLKPEVSRDTEVLSRFQQEAQSASGIGNQHIIDISDFGSLPDGSTYFVMEYLDGTSLTGAIESSPESGGAPMLPQRVVHIAKQLCDALGAAHERSIVHRDMKPDNVFLIKRGGDPDFVKVLDFGIAKVGGSSSKLTKAGQVFGTPHYMSPEQCAGSTVDQRTDIYAIGVILYEMSCGRVPFDADNLMGILTKHMYEQPLPPHQMPPPVNVPAGLESIILKCLAKSTEARYQSMAELREDLVMLEQGLTPRAVIDGMDRASGGPMPNRGDGTGRIPVQSMLRMDVGGEGHESAPPKSKLPLFLGLGALATLVIGAGIAVAIAVQPAPTPPIATPLVATPDTAADPRGHDTSEQGAIAAGDDVAGADVAEGPSTDVEPAVPVVMITIRTEPEGVEVWRGEELLGNTPFEIPRPGEGERLELSLRKAGFQSQSAVLSSLTAPMVRITLAAERQRGTGRRHGTGAQGQTTQQGQTPPPQTQQQQGPSEVLDPWR